MSKNLIKLPNMPLVSTGNLNAYIIAAYNIPVLSAEEEARLATLVRQKEDISAAHKLAIHHLRFVIQVARGYIGYGLALEDLIQEGNVGLMKALKKFDPAIGVRLISFAVHWIRAEIHEFIIKNWRIVKIATTKAQRKLFFKLRSSKKRLGWMNPEEIKQVATDLGVKPEEVAEMERRLSNNEVSFDPQPTNENENLLYSPEAFIDQSQTNQNDPSEMIENMQWKEHFQEKLEKAMANLDERSQDILKSRWLSENKKTLATTAKKYNVSPERIRQIENQAIKKLKSAIVPMTANKETK